MADMDKSGNDADSLDQKNNVEVPLTEEELHEIKVKEAERQIEMDRYLMIDDDARKSGIAKSVILITVTAVVVFISLFFSVSSSLDDGNVSEMTEKNRKLYLNYFEKKYALKRNGETSSSSSNSVIDFKFVDDRFLVSFSIRNADSVFKGEMTPLDVKNLGKDFLAQSLCSDGLEKIHRNLGINEVDYLFYQENILRYTVKISEQNCNALKSLS